jgi:hypothetical protein
MPRLGQFTSIALTKIALAIKSRIWSTPPSTVSGGGGFYGIGVSSSDRFVAVGQTGAPGSPIFSTSVDGITWTTTAYFNSYAPNNGEYMTKVTWNPVASLFIATGSGANAQCTYSTSSNGTTWTTPANINSYVFQPYGMATNSSGLTVTLGLGDTVAYPNSNNYPMITTTSNGSTWSTPARISGSSNTQWFHGIAVNSSGLFVAVGYDDTTTKYPIYSTSSNGTTWATPARMNGSTTSAYMQGVAWSPTLNLFVAVGGNSTLSYAIYATSANGSTWTTPAVIVPGFNYSPMLTSIVWNSAKGLFVATGTGASGITALYTTSADGSTWSVPVVINLTGNALNLYNSSLAVNSLGKCVVVAVNGSYSVGNF